MPLYDYQCKACRTVTEVRHGFREEYRGTCPSCGGAELARVFNPAPILFKGSGFYVTDSRPSAATSGGAEKKTETKTEAKPEAKSETKSESSAA